MAIFCCLVLALPFSLEYSPFPAQSRSGPLPVVPPTVEYKNKGYQQPPFIGFTARRNLLTTGGSAAIIENTLENDVYSYLKEDGCNSRGNSSKLGFEIITIEDVLNDELMKAEDKGIGFVSIKQGALYTPSPENGTLATMPMVISNKIHHHYISENKY